MANKTSDRSVVRVGVGTSEAQCCVPSIGGRDIPRSKSYDLSLGCSCCIFCRLVGATDVGQLIVDAVGDDRWVESLLLSLVDERIDGLEGKCGCGATVKTSLEFHGWDTESEVETSDRGGNETVKVSGNGVGDGSESDTWGCAEKG